MVRFVKDQPDAYVYSSFGSRIFIGGLLMSLLYFGIGIGAYLYSQEIMTLYTKHFGGGSDLSGIPVIGDLIGGVLSTYILYSGIKLGAPPKIVAQMATNIAIDFAIGSIPIIGDIFDIIWKANVKNIELIEKNTLENEENKGINYLITATLIVALLGIILVILGLLS